MGVTGRTTIVTTDCTTTGTAGGAGAEQIRRCGHGLLPRVRLDAEREDNGGRRIPGLAGVCAAIGAKMTVGRTKNDTKINFEGRTKIESHPQLLPRGPGRPDRQPRS